MAQIIQACLATTRPSSSYQLLEDLVPAYEEFFGTPCPIGIALVTVDAEGDDRTLIIDQDWIDLARTAREIDPDLIEDLDVPPSAILAVVPGAPEEWPVIDRRRYRWSLSSDGVMVLVPEGPKA